MRVKINWKSFFGGAAVGSLIALLWKRKESHFDLLPARAVWQHTLGREVGEVPAAMTTGRVQARYHALLRDRPHFDHPALRQHLEKSILPGLALYLVLKEETGDDALAKARTSLLLDGAARQRYAAISSISNLPFFFPLFRFGTKRLLSAEYPSAGWETEWVRDDVEAIAFNMKSCFYLKVLTAYGVPELVPLFCHTDEAGMEGISSLVFERSTTLARGGAVCDFCYRKAN